MKYITKMHLELLCYHIENESSHNISHTKRCSQVGEYQRLPIDFDAQRCDDERQGWYWMIFDSDLATEQTKEI